MVRVTPVRKSGLHWKAVAWLSIGWQLPLALVGMVMLARFVPWGTREPQFVVEERPPGEPLSAFGLTWRGATGGALGVVGRTSATVPPRSAPRTAPATACR